MASVYLVTIYITLCPFFVRTFYTILHRDIYITRLFLHSTLHRDIFFHHVERQLHTLYTETIFLVMNVAWVNVTFPAATICDDFGASLRPLAESFGVLSPGPLTHALLIHFSICLVVLCHASSVLVRCSESDVVCMSKLTSSFYHEACCNT